MIVELTVLLVAGVGNLAWDLTGRRFSARARRRARRERRRESLPLPAADERAHDPFADLDSLAPQLFVEQTRTTAEELDRVVDHFDLVLLRAEAGESLTGDIVYIGASAPRERGRELLQAWLESAAALPHVVEERLRELGLPDKYLAETLERERARTRWPQSDTDSAMITATADDFEGAFVALVAFLRSLTVATSDPYR